MKTVASKIGLSPGKQLLSSREKMLLTAIVVYSFIPTFGGLLRLVDLANGSSMLPDNLRALSAPLPIVLHILSSFVFCIFGAVQFSPSIRRNQPDMHQMVGRFVAIAGCVSAATGLWMTVYFVFPAELQGSLLYVARIVLGIAMIGCIFRALVAIRSKNVPQHSAFMLRAYAIGQGASTQAFLGIGWMIFTQTELSGALRDVQMVFAWVLNLMVAELLIRKRLPPRRFQTPGADAARARTQSHPITVK